LEISKKKIKEVVSKDAIIVHVNNAIEEIEKSLNIFTERLREWYSLHFPEMDRVVTDHKKFAEIVEKFGSREKIDDREIKQFTQRSMGMDFNEDDIKIIQGFSSEILRLYNLRDELTKYLEKILKIIAPNFAELAGATLTAKFISKAGSMEKLAKMPSSTIQLLGAEKALFKFLHGEGRSPRFGIIYSHPLIQNSPEKLKGKIARLLASKLSIAAKMDYYSKEYKAEQLKTDLGKKVKEILRG
jgi:nucleolar protein 56